MGRYAAQTTVTPERSQEQIKSTLRRYGAEAIATMERSDVAMMGFEIRNLAIRIDVSLPNREDFATSETGRDRSERATQKAHEKAIRQRWRALHLAIKAKLEAVETGISTIEQEFMPFVVMPDGRQLGDHILPRLGEIAATGKMPKLLTAGRANG